MPDIEAMLTSSQRNVNGTAILKLRPYGFETVGVDSDDDLTKSKLGEYGETRRIGKSGDNHAELPRDDGQAEHYDAPEWRAGGVSAHGVCRCQVSKKRCKISNYPTHRPLPAPSRSDKGAATVDSGC